MGKFVIDGGVPLEGTVPIGGAKNAVLPIIAASLLTEGKCTIKGMPQLEDVRTICLVLEALGVKLWGDDDDNSIQVHPINLVSVNPYELVRKMRASFLVMGPSAGRFEGQGLLPGMCHRYQAR